MEDKVCPSATAMVIQTCSVAPEMAGNNALVSDFVEQEESSIMDSQEKDSSKWTNEKHSLYLRSIEASFIDQLYNSLDTSSCRRQDSCCFDAISTRKNHPAACNSSGQFKVLHRGCWSKKSSRGQHSHMKDADRPRVSPGNPWIQHFRNGSIKRLSSIATSLQCPGPENDSQLDQEPGCSNTEAMDQNFVEDGSCSRKRVRASKIGQSSNDQVVPHCFSAATEIPDSYVSPEK